MTENLKGILERQKQVTSQLEAEYKSLADSDLSRELERAKNNLALTGAQLEQLTKEHDALKTENAGLKKALYEQIYSEKLAILNFSAAKVEALFASENGQDINRLASFEAQVKNRIASMRRTLEQSEIRAKEEIQAKIYEVEKLLYDTISKMKTNRSEWSGVLNQEEQAQLDRMKNEAVPEQVLQKRIKQNNFERFVGLNLINKLGILLIVIGAIVAAQYTYFRLGGAFRGLMLFALGGVMLGAGEIMNRKKANIFSLGVTSGGIAVLYIALATSYFGLKIIGMYPALLLCVLITAGAFLLSLRHNAKVILAFALVGGYLPIFAANGAAMIYGLMVYLVLLNLLALLVSFKKKWVVTTAIGLGLNIPASIYMVYTIFQGYINPASLVSRLLGVLYILFAFLSYTIIPIISSIRGKTKLRVSEIAFLAINTFFSSLIMYLAFYLYDFQDFNGLLAIIFAAAYTLLARIIERKTPDGKRSSILFYITGFSFVTLIVPLQFDLVWISLGWLVEGVLLAMFGVIKEDRRFKIPGYIICGLCLACFVLFDIHDGYLFAYKYLAITLGSLLILGAHWYKKRLDTPFARIFKVIVIANLWVYSMYVINVELYKLVQNFTFVDPRYMCGAISIMCGYIIGFAVTRMRRLADSGVRAVTWMIYGINTLILFLLNAVRSPFVVRVAQASAIDITLGTGLLLIVSLFAVFVVYDLMKGIAKQVKIGSQWIAIAVSGFLVVILTQALIAQYSMAFSSAIISVIYMVAALLWIIFGFVKRYAALRRVGLALSIVSVLKLFLIDLRGLTQGRQIITYFALGITLLGISFVYQFFNKRLDAKLEITTGVQNENR